MMTTFAASYGYLAVFFGTLFEGEIILVAAGFAAQRGLLALPGVIAIAIVGAGIVPGCKILRKTTPNGRRRGRP